MPSSLTPGTFVLHSRAVPDLSAGSYRVHTEQKVDAPGATAETRDTYIEVTAPRYVLPPDQVLSTFPPNQAQGAFDARLAQIVLKRRTLPWEREVDLTRAADAEPSGIPWLALVLLAEGECEFKTARPVADCVTPGVVLTGRQDAAVGNCITVTRTVVEQVFPAKEELPLLAHVREVDLSDTELAMGDDDGWLSVVLSNRLPQPGVRYRACLISLEGQYDRLPEDVAVAAEPKLAFRSPYVYPAAVGVLASPSPGGATGGRPAARSRSIADAWSSGSAKQVSAMSRSGPASKSTSFSVTGVARALPGALHASDLAVLHPGEPLYTFPVLTSWQFTCTGEADFEALMRKLDVGMLDTVPLPAPVAAGEKPPAPKRADPAVTYTGHIALAYVDRNGDEGVAWYRGPLVPHPGGRDEAVDGVLPLLHASDQARRMGPDGRDNLSLAAAFEIGRLLALAEPSVVAAFLNWRKEGFEVARRRALVATDVKLAALTAVDPVFGLGALAGLRLVAGLGAAEAAALGPARPLVDPGHVIQGIDGLDLVELISTGFGVPARLVAELIRPTAERAGALTAPTAAVPTDMGTLAERGATELAHLTTAARRRAGDIAAAALEADPTRVPR